jgi:outer membrane protein OmpA-like peptidoglycan-associated protein
MKKSVLFLGFCLCGAHDAGAESLDIFFQDQTSSQQPAPQATDSDEKQSNVARESNVIKPQVLYLEDLNPPEQPKALAAPEASQPKTVAKAKTKASRGAASESSPVALPTPLTPAKQGVSPTASTTSGSGKIKKEPLPKNLSQAPSASPVPVPPAAKTAPAQAPVVPKSIVQNRNEQQDNQQNTRPESRQTLSSFQEQHQGQYAPFATQTSRQQAAHSLVTQAKNEGRSYPAGLDPFVVEFDQTFAVLSPNTAIRDLYKTAPITPPALKEPGLSFNATPPAPALPVLTTIESVKKPKAVTNKADQQPQEKTPSPTETTNTVVVAEPQEQTPSPTETTNTVVVEDTPSAHTTGTEKNLNSSSSSPLATVMVPETAQALDPASQTLLDQVAAAYHEGTLTVIQITGYVNTRSGQDEDVRGYTHIQSLGRRGAALVVDYLKGKNVPESAMAYRIIPTSTIALQNPFYPSSLSTENSLRLDIAGGRS